MRTLGTAALRSTRAAGMLSLAFSVLASPPALAWDPATTHAGLTERALSISKFHAVLAQQLGRALGGFEPLRLDAGAQGADAARSLGSRLEGLDPAGGYRPGPDGIALASAWVRAGAVLEMTPPERGRHHFLEPRKRAGLDDGPGLSGAVHAARLTLDDGATVRDTATGSAFGLEGLSALDWVWSPRNDLGLPAFFDNWERAVSAPQAALRETALVRALLALGGTLAVLEDMGQPAFVRNDFRAEFLAHDAGSEFERFVADRFGSVALPPSSAAVSRHDVDSFFVATDGKGLAQATQERFFSPGTLPQDIRLAAGEKTSDLVRLLNQTLPFPAPRLTTLELGQPGETRYFHQDGVRVLAYQRGANKIHFFLDRVVYADCARRWLPVVEGYAAGMVDHLLRAKLVISVAQGKATLTASGFAGQIETGARLRVLAEDATGGRKEIAQVPLQPDLPLTFEVPPGTRKIAAVARGRDGGGVFVAAGEVTAP